MLALERIFYLASWEMETESHKSPASMKRNLDRLRRPTSNGFIKHIVPSLRFDRRGLEIRDSGLPNIGRVLNRNLERILLGDTWLRRLWKTANLSLTTKRVKLNGFGTPCC